MFSNMADDAEFEVQDRIYHSRSKVFGGYVGQFKFPFSFASASKVLRQWIKKWSKNDLYMWESRKDPFPDMLPGT